MLQRQVAKAIRSIAGAAAGGTLSLVSMTNKENALRIIRFDHPERVVCGIPSYWVAYRGCNHESIDNFGGDNDVPPGTVWTDIWGTIWRKELPGIMGFPQQHAMADLAADLGRYRWPDANDERICAPIYAAANGFAHDDRFLVGSHRQTLWEKACTVAAMQNLMMALYAEPEAARELFHRVMDFQLGIAEHYLKVGVEMVFFTDDLGTRCGPLVGPKVVEEFLVPEYRRLFNLYKSRDVLINFHSCGRIDSVIDTLMELGINILNPVQVSANDLDLVRRKTAGRVALAGGINNVTIINGPPHAIVEEVRRRLWQLGRDGGYFCGADQHMVFPKGHLEAMIGAVETFGRYPIERPA